MSSYEHFTRGLDGLAAYVDELPGRIERNAVRAINKGADRTRTLEDKRIREQLNFKASYLAPSAGRLVVKSRASVGALEARIGARDRPTSLAQFLTSGALGKKGGVSVQVKKGHTTTLPKAFLVKLRAGAELDDDRYNVGLAVRLKAGESVHNKNVQIKMTKSGLALLYGPSVGQAMRLDIDKSGLAEESADIVQAEFDRLMEAGI